MGMTQKLQRSRYELKYIIDPLTATNVRNFVRPFLERDENARPEMRWAYPIYSLYLDNPGLDLFYGTVHGHKNRFKLRVRYYDFNPASPVFFEIKRRVYDIIKKDRGGVKRESLNELLAGRCPRQSDLLKPDNPDAWYALRFFIDLMNKVGARGHTIVAYEREAWVSPHDNSVRVTFDYDIRGARWEGVLGPDEHKWSRPRVNGVVLELKFTDRFPTWMRDLVRACNLTRTSMAKYVNCVFSLSHNKPAARCL